MLVGKKIREAKEDGREEGDIYVEAKETVGEKVRKASMFAVGAARVGAEKVAEGIRDISEKDMVQSGQQAVSAAKEKLDLICQDLEELKNMVVSITVNSAEKVKEAAFGAAEAAKTATESVGEAVSDGTDELAAAAKVTAEEAAELFHSDDEQSEYM